MSSDKLKVLAPQVDAEAGNDLLKWAGRAFALLTGILTFFGIKEGVLARVVHENQIGAMGVLLLLGLGTLLALAAPAVKDTVHVPVYAVLAAVVALLWVTEWLSSDLPLNALAKDLELAKWVLTGVAVLCIVGLAVAGTKMPWSFAFAVVAVTSVSAGLYMAAKMSVLDNGATGQASVTAAFEKSDGGIQVKVDASGDAIYSPLHVLVRGEAAEGALPDLGTATFVANRSGELKGTLTTLLPAGTTKVTVLTCQDPESPGSGSCKPTTTQLQLAVPAVDRRVGGGLVSADGQSLTYTVDGFNVPSGSHYEVTLSSAPASSASKLSLVPKADGTFTSTGTVKPTKGQTWTLSAAYCAKARNCEKAVTVAQYTFR